MAIIFPTSATPNVTPLRLDAVTLQKKYTFFLGCFANSFYLCS